MNHVRPPGPLRAHPPAEDLPHARLRVLRAVGRHEPVTTAELTRVLGGHENTTRQHLDALSRDGYVRGRHNRGRMGRPSVSYSLSPTGMTHLAGRSASAEHTALVATLSDHLVATSDDPAAEARRVGRQWGRRLAQPLDEGAGEISSDPGRATAATPDADPVPGVLDLLASLGFSPVVEDDAAHEDEDTTGGPGSGAGAAAGVHRPVDLVLRTCPLLDAARERPDVVCRVHEGLVAGFVRARGSEADVTVVPFAAARGCRATITRG